MRISLISTNTNSCTGHGEVVWTMPSEHKAREYGGLCYHTESSALHASESSALHASVRALDLGFHAWLLLLSASSSSEACLVHLHGRHASASLRLQPCMQRERERERGASERARERSERARERWGLVPVSMRGCWSSGLVPHKKAGEQSPTHISH